MLSGINLAAFDSSTWVSWFRDKESDQPHIRNRANSFFPTLLRKGIIPFLSFHHLEEIVGVESQEDVLKRIEHIQGIDFAAWFRTSRSVYYVGGTSDLVCDEVHTFLRYGGTPQQVANRVRRENLVVGPAIGAIGDQNEIYLVLQHSWRNSQPSIGAITSLQNDEFSKEDPTLAELSTRVLRHPTESQQVFAAIRAKAAKTLIEAGGLDPNDAEIQANKFISDVLQHSPAEGQSAKDFLIEVLTAMGCTANDFNESSKLSELSNLSVFRSQINLLREKIGCSPDDLKCVQPTDIPSQIVKSALNKYGQKRQDRPASDLNDKYLASLLPYVDFVVADKRTRHDFSLVGKKFKPLNSLGVGQILSAPDYVSAGERILKALAAH